MRFFRVFLFVTMFLLAARLVSWAEDRQPLPTPVMGSVDPEKVKPGDVATASGNYLDEPSVIEVYITDGKTDLKVDVLERKARSLKFRVPANAAPGRYNMLVLLNRTEPQLIEEPARIQVQ